MGKRFRGLIGESKRWPIDYAAGPSFKQPIPQPVCGPQASFPNMSQTHGPQQLNYLGMSSGPRTQVFHIPEISSPFNLSVPKPSLMHPSQEAQCSILGPPPHVGSQTFIPGSSSSASMGMDLRLDSGIGPTQIHPVGQPVPMGQPISITKHTHRLKLLISLLLVYLKN